MMPPERRAYTRPSSGCSSGNGGRTFGTKFGSHAPNAAKFARACVRLREPAASGNVL